MNTQNFMPEEEVLQEKSLAATADTELDQQILKFLVVEDDFSLQPIWEKIIKAIDSRAIIKWAISEEGAEQLVRDFMKTDDEFDFIICDLLLAGKRNGVDLWKRYKGKTSTFLFATGVSDRALKHLIGDDWGQYPFLIRKPLDPEICISTMKAMLDYKHVLKNSEYKQ